MAIIESDSTYIHYGNRRFDAQRGFPIHNTWRNKPDGGLWASPIYSKYGWIDWCKDEEFRKYDSNNHFMFRLKPNNRVLTIISESDIADVPMAKDSPLHDRFITHIDFEKLLSMGIDAVEIAVNEFTYWELYGWDCDSIVILNPDCVEVINED